jgi:hypothetical protein
MNGMPPTESVLPMPFGISADTGRPLSGLAEETIGHMVGEERETPEKAALCERADASQTSFALGEGIDASDLGQTGWGIIYGPNVDTKIKDALLPLIEHRRSLANPVRIFEGSDGFLRGDTADRWLARRNVRMDVVDPELGVPFYLLIVGSPEDVPFEFQYAMDIYWAVGRLWFDDADAFRRYAESVVAYEKASTVPASRRALMFATEHDFDAATQLFTRQVAHPLSGEGAKSTSIWNKRQFRLDALLGEAATKQAMADVFLGRSGTPSLLVSGSHGMEFRPDDPRQRDCQGAIVCQDWEGFGSISERHWFAASDLPGDAKLHGMVHFLYACHGGGSPELDNYDRLNGAPKRIASGPFLSSLPTKMLSHQNGGALAILAHVERAWAYSFQGQRGGSQVQGFRDVLACLLLGQRIGQATDRFNVRWATISAELADLESDLRRGAEVSKRALGNLWVARDDARNFIVLGDPAVRLRVEDMPAL